VTGVSEALDLRTGLGAGSHELWDLLRELLGGADPAERIESLRQLKARVYRLEFSSDAAAPWRSIVLKRLDPAVAQRARLVVERWLPALGLRDRCAQLLGTAADRTGEVVWHVYEDLGDQTLAVRPAPESAGATLELIAELHTRAACHPVLPDARRYGEAFGIEYFTANVADATAALEALTQSKILPPPDCAGVSTRLLERLYGLAEDVSRRARAFQEASGPDTLLHGDLWTINAFVHETPAGPRVRLIDWDKVGVGPFSYDLSAFLLRFPATERPWLLERYGEAVARAGWRLAPASELRLLFDTAERARYANRVIWPALALVKERAEWGFPELAEVERWFQTLDRSNPWP
jgi:hypothetical protein